MPPAGLLKATVNAAHAGDTMDNFNAASIIEQGRQNQWVF